MDSVETHIIECAKKLERLEDYFLKLWHGFQINKDKDKRNEYAKKLWLIGLKAYEIKNDISANLPDYTESLIHDLNVRSTLKKIHNESISSINFFRSYSNAIEGIAKHVFGLSLKFDDITKLKYNDWRDDFFKKFQLTSFYTSILEIFPISNSTSLPMEIRPIFREILQAYALNLRYSVVSLSRTTLEMLLFKKLNILGVFQRSKIIDISSERPDQLYRLIYLASVEKLLDNKTEKLANEVRINSEQILRIKNENIKVGVDKTKTISIVANTIAVIGKLFE